MATLKLDISYDFDFDLVGVVSSLPPYQLAWNINKLLQIDLIKQPDITIDFMRKSISISNYLFTEKYSYLRIIRNKSTEEVSSTPMELFEVSRSDYFLPELKKFDYLLLVEGSIKKRYVHDVVEILQKVQQIQLISQIDLDDIKDKDNLIFE